MEAQADIRSRAATLLRRRYYLSFLSVPLIDFGFALIFGISLQGYVTGAALFLTLAVLLGWWLFRPIERFLRHPDSSPFPEYEIATLARNTTLLLAVLIGLQTAANFFLIPHLLEPKPTETLSRLQLSVLPFLRWAYFTAVVYFVMADFTRVLRQQLHGLWQRTVAPQPGRLTTRLLIGFALTSVIPLTLVLIDTLDVEAGIRIDLLQDIAAAAFGLVVATVFITRNLLAPLGALEQTIQKVGTGTLETTAPILSNDETGRLASGFNRMIEGLRERQFIRETFGKYVPERVASAILADRGRLEPVETEATILFCDLEDFTGLTERHTPAGVVALLNQYFAATLAVIERHGGVVNQFQGDGMLVTFNIPVPDVHHADEAVEAATDMIRAMEATDFGAESLRIRIGVATGVVLAGNVGAGSRLSYTVHGDAVNLAARLEQMNKAFGSRVLISGATAARLTRGQRIETVGAITVRGKQHPVPVYQAIVGTSESRSP